MSVVISGSGLYTPPHSISNDELVGAFNQYVEEYNTENRAAIDAGELEELKPSSSESLRPRLADSSLHNDLHQKFRYHQPRSLWPRP